MMDWGHLITNKRLGQEHRRSIRHDDRSEFKRDYDRLIFSAPFRRLQNKTQVFPLPGSIFVHNRLTHSLEVACVGMSLGNDVASKLLTLHPELRETLIDQIGQIVSTACLAHDLGNPPFGHSGEKAIQSFFIEGEGKSLHNMVSSMLWSDLTHFEGNANSFRLLTHQFCGRRPGGYVMTYPTLGAVVKYPCESVVANSNGKFGFFYSERDIFCRLAEGMNIMRLSSKDEPLRYVRHPLVYLVEAADDICYEIMDIEDAHKLHIVSSEETSELFLNFFDSEAKENILQRIREENLTDENEKVVYMRSCVIGALEQECAKVFVENEEKILSGVLDAPLIDLMNERLRKAYCLCIEISEDKIYRSKPVLDVELAGYRIIETLLEQMIEAVVYPKLYHSRQLIDRVSSQYDITSSDLDTRIMAVVDYISGMTDIYALDVYQKISGVSLPVI